MILQDRDAPRLKPVMEALLGRNLLTRPEVVARSRAAIVGKIPFASGRVGPSMIAVQYLSARRGDSTPADARDILLFQGHRQSGLFPAEPALWAPYLARYQAAIARLDIAALLLQPSPMTIATTRDWTGPALAAFGDTEPGRLVPDRPEDCYLPSLAGKRVLLVCPFADLLAARANRATFEAVWANTGKPWFYPAAVDSLEFPYGFADDAAARYGTVDGLCEHLCAEISRRDFDVALVAAAGLAVPLVAHVRDLGRVGLDVGGHLQVLFGVRGKRWKDDADFAGTYFNDHWIDMPARYQPNRADVCDQGAYW